MFKKIVSSNNSAWVFDFDGILVVTPNPVLSYCEKISGVKLRPDEINSWDFVGRSLRKAGCGESMIQGDENAWYDPDLLSEAPRYLYSGSIVRRTMQISCGNTFILTARMPRLRGVTKSSMDCLYPTMSHNNL